MRVDEVAVFGVILHTCAHAAPHILIHLAVDAIGLGAERSEVNVSACDGILCGKNVIVHRTLIEICILTVVSGIEERLREFQHVVGVAGFRSVAFVHVAL